MKIFNLTLISIYTIFFIIIGSIMITFSLRVEYFNLLANALQSLSEPRVVRLDIAIPGLLLVILNIFILQFSLTSIKKDKTIAFNNPSGQVTVSLMAIEDYIKKLTNELPEIKDIKLSISNLKTGIEVRCRVALYADTNIPEITEKIQNAVRIRLQEMLGIEDTINIVVHVSKIFRQSKKIKPVSQEASNNTYKGEL